MAGRMYLKLMIQTMVAPMADYTWKVLRSDNPNKAWIVDVSGVPKKISALMSLAAAERIAVAHNLIVGFLNHQNEYSEKKD